MTQGIQEQGRRLAAIKAELHLREIGREVLRADLVPASNYSTLQQRESRFDSIGMNVAININLVTVTNRLMLGAFDASGNHRLGISRQFVGYHHINVSTNVFLDVVRQCPRLS